MRIVTNCTNWLETHWVNPAYSGWLISGLAIFFFGSATNTMAGWLYVISGVMIAILVLAASLSWQTLRGLKLTRAAIAPVSVGELLLLTLTVENQTNQPKTLIQVQDDLPLPLRPIRTAIEQIPARSAYHWAAEVPTHQRGIYHWQTVQLRTAAPLGLFWRRRYHAVKAKAVVYPTVLSLAHCPLVDEMGQDSNQQHSYYQSRLATEGITRTLRPYRWGDSSRLIHWRSSARYGELRVRELETYIGGQELVIGLDSAAVWDRNQFEQAVVAAASIYFYALHHQVQVSLWIATTGMLRSESAVLEALAAVQPQAATADRPQIPLLWLTSDPAGLATLPLGSRWLLWPLPNAQGVRSHNSPQNIVESNHPGIMIQPEQPLQLQLQAPLTKSLLG